jgi:hypothetical protein
VFIPELSVLAFNFLTKTKTVYTALIANFNHVKKKCIFNSGNAYTQKIMVFMNKQLLIVLLGILVSFSSFAQSKFDNWPEMKSFHTTLSQTFHPAEDGDMKPIRTRSHEMLTSVKLINASHLPKQYETEDMKKILKRLEKETDKLNAIIVRQEQSATIMKQFTVVHNTFHEVAGMCKGDDKK